jgi:hypothetical protein
LKAKVVAKIIQVGSILSSNPSGVQIDPVKVLAQVSTEEGGLGLSGSGRPLSGVHVRVFDDMNFVPKAFLKEKLQGFGATLNQHGIQSLLHKDLMPGLESLGALGWPRIRRVVRWPGQMEGLGISMHNLKIKGPGSGIPCNGDARMGRTRQPGIQNRVVKKEGAGAHQQGGLFPAEAMDPTLCLGSADSRPGPVFSLVKVPVRGSSPFEYGIGSILVDHGFEASVHPAGFFFQNGTADLKAGGSKSFQTSALDQGMGIGAGVDHRSNSRCKDGLRAGRGSAVMIARFQADIERGGRSSSFTDLVILEVGLPSL